MTFLVVFTIALFVATAPSEVGPNKNPLFYSPFDGEVPEFGIPLGVMIENEVTARPFQTGIAEADIVYEAPTEGNITRFLAIFAPGRYPEKMGPVRSARTYFLDWVHEYNAVYAHVGGNPDALARLQREKIFNADQFIFEKYFWRENMGKTALEHTMFTSGKKMEKLIEEKGWNEMENRNGVGGKWKGVMERGNWKGEGAEATKISIDFGAPSYRIEYRFDARSGKYLRFQTKKPHIDYGNNKQLAAKTIVIQRVASWPNGDTEGSISIKTIGEGNAIIFQNGRAIEANWKKASLEARTEFFDKKTGQKITFHEGPVWFEILPLNNSFSYSGETGADAGIPILMYHHVGTVPPEEKWNAVRKDLTVSSENFESQLKWLKENGYITASFTDALSPPPQKTVILSFDDGYDDAYTEAFPLLKKYGFHGAFAVITGKIGTSGYLSWDQILEMKKAGMEFLSHTVLHPDLPSLSNTVLAKELSESKKTLEEKGLAVSGFVYPAGKFNKRVIEAVKKVGYSLARTTQPGWVTKKFKPYELPTIRIRGNATIADFIELMNPPSSF